MRLMDVRKQDLRRAVRNLIKMIDHGKYHHNWEEISEVYEKMKMAEMLLIDATSIIRIIDEKARENENTHREVHEKGIQD